MWISSWSFVLVQFGQNWLALFYLSNGKGCDSLKIMLIQPAKVRTGWMAKYSQGAKIAQDIRYTTIDWGRLRKWFDLVKKILQQDLGLKCLAWDVFGYK